MGFGMAKGSFIGAMLLVAGTCIGGGMLALPVATSMAGFFPSLVMMLVGWAFMTLTALFLSEVNLWMEEGAHVMTMASRFLGPIGKAVAWILYLFIGYASLVAYTAGGGGLMQVGVESIFGLSMPHPIAATVFIIIFGLIIYLGNIVVGRINTILMVGLIISYILLITLGSSQVKWQNLKIHDFCKTIIAVPLLLTIFSFQTIVPSLTLYLQKDGKILRRAIICGTTLALLIYIIWQWLVLGTVSQEGEFGLKNALIQGKPATDFLRMAVGNPWVARAADFFAFFALVTSFLGIALGLFDFLSDGLKISRKGLGSIALGLLVAGPTLFFAISMEKVFLTALDSSGGIGDAILNGLMPSLMLYIGRYKMNLQSDYRIPGGKGIIYLAIVYALFVFTIEILGKFGIILSIYQC